MHYIECLDGITDFTKSKEALTSKNLIVKEYEELYMVKYDKLHCDMNEPDVKKCRGIILEKGTNKLVCVPPPKAEKAELFNSIPIEKTEFEEFVEGTMINIFKYKGALFMSTRSCLGGYNKFYSNKTFNTLFTEIIDISKFNVINDNLNLTFILQHPDNIIVTKYSQPSIKLVYGVNINDMAIEYLKLTDLKFNLEKKGLSFEIPKVYVVTDTNEVYQHLSKMNHGEQGIILKSVNDTYIRSKIWNEYYKYVRNLKGNSSNKKFMYLMLRQNNGLDEYLKYFEEDVAIFEQFRLELFETTNKLFNFYQDYHVKKDENKQRVIKKFLDIDYEYRPLCNDLHNDYLNTKKITDKKKIIDYINKLPSAKLLFVINYKYRVTN